MNENKINIDKRKNKVKIYIEYKQKSILILKKEIENIFPMLNIKRKIRRRNTLLKMLSITYNFHLSKLEIKAKVFFFFKEYGFLYLFST
jgi:hypothetical protein